MHLSYSNMSAADFNAMRQSLCAFFQDRKVKVSLFLHDHTQNHDGSIVVPNTGMLPPGQDAPGTVRYFQDNQEVGREALAPVSAAAWTLNSGLRTTLGSNLYEKDRTNAPEGAPAAAAPLDSAAAASQIPSAPAPAPESPVKDSTKTAAAVGELNMLASLIGCAPAAQDDHFKLENLFGANVFGIREPKARGAEVIQIDGTANTEYQSGLDSIRQQMEATGAAPAPAGEDDLLDLLDQA
jgi:hypothetical protein